MRRTLDERLQTFRDSGLLPHTPTRFQRFLGQLEMVGYVISPDATDAERYSGAPLGGPLVRQPLSAALVGIDHFRVGDGLGASLGGLCRHLLFVFHQGMPNYDLQLIQTHPDGLETLRRFMEDAQTEQTPRGRRLSRAAGWIVPDSKDYREQFLRPGGWIDRAVRFDYDPPPSTDPSLRPEFNSLVRFLVYCHDHYPEHPGALEWQRWPQTLLTIGTTRWRNIQ